MLNYKDMTFCHSPCTNYECGRKLTQKVVEDAREWWGGKDAPIAMADFADLCPEHRVDFPEELEMEDEHND